MIPREGDPALKTWKGDSWRYTSAGNVWALMSADDELGYVYLPTTSVTNDMYGGQGRFNCRARLAAPLGQGRRSIARRACCTCRR